MEIFHEPLRYAHEEGHTDVCYAENGETFITCGADGDIRIWSSDDGGDPRHICIGEWALSIRQKQDKWYVATSSNDIQILSHPEGNRDGVLDRYTAPINQIAVCKNKNVVALAGEDMEVKIISLEDEKKVVVLSDLTGPCLSVALCPLATKVAASSGDGNLRIWDIETTTVIKEIACFPKVNSFANAKTLCRIDFDNNEGKYLAYPNGNSVVLLNTNDWSENVLQCVKVSVSYSIVQFSHCSRYLTAASIEGDFVIWTVHSKQVLKTTKHEKSLAICGFMWNPKENDKIVYTDVEGQLGIMSNCITITSTENVVIDENGFMENEVDFGDVQFEDDDAENENAISVYEIKKQFLDSCEQELKEIEGRSSRSTTPRPRTPETPLQAPFMPSSTPEHLDPRYLCWNEVGIVKSYGNNTDDELSSKSIEVEFHDTTFHNSMMMPNYQDYFIGALSKGALVVANSTQVNVVPLLGSSKDWMLKCDEFEEIILVATSEKLVCLGMANYMVRVCSVYGTQRAVITVPGPLVSISAFKDTFIVAYHMAGVRKKDQCMNLKLFTLEGMTLKSKDLGSALGPESTLLWLGFSDTGTPGMMDSLGAISLYPNSCNTWIPCCNTRKHHKSPIDGFFVTAIFESYQVIAGIKCKGSVYPTIIPRPTVCELTIEPVFIEPDTEKTQMEANLFTWSVLKVSDIDKKFKETALKTFALACKNDLDQRAFEVMEIIANPQILNLGLKYATKLEKRRLAEKLTDLAAKLMEQPNENDLEDTETPNRETLLKPPAIRRLSSLNSKHIKKLSKQKSEDSNNSIKEKKESIDTQESLFNSEDSQNISDSSVMTPNSQNFSNHTPGNPFLKKSTSKVSNPLSLTDNIAGISYSNGKNCKTGEKRKLSDPEPEEQKGKQKKINRFLFNKQ